MAIKGLKAWSQKLSKLDMPALGSVIRELNELTGSDESDINQLVEVILKDANLTSQVLRIANSVHYNPSSKPINTISRAIVLLGFNGVRAICISLMMVDSLLGSKPRDQLLQSLARAFHAAVQARNIVRRTNDEFKEEVFVAALLLHVGEMAFWACGGESAEQLEKLLSKPGVSERDACDQVLGTQLKSLTRELVSNWKLGATLKEALNTKSKPSPKVVAVLLGDKISRASEQGWDSPEMGELLAKMSQFTKVGFAESQQLAMDAADEAAQVALTYGAAQVCHLIPAPSVKLEQKAEKQKTPAMQADPRVQLNILRDLSNAMKENLDVNTLFQMVLEGMHRGIGLERVCVAFIAKGQVTAKYVLGEGTAGWRDDFQFGYRQGGSDLISYAIDEQEPIWINGQCHGSMAHLYTPQVQAVVGRLPAFLSVVDVNGRNVALFYADRWNLGGKLDDEQFESFRHFVLQTKINLELLARAS